MIMRALIGSMAALALAGGATAQDFLQLKGGDGPGKGKHVVLLAGDEEYRSEEAMPMLAKILARQGFDCTVCFSVDPATGEISPNQGDSLTNPAALDSADAIVMLLRFRHWPDETMRKFDAAIKRGVPVIALRTSTHAFQFKDGPWKPYNGFGKNVLGEGWVSHWGHHKFEATRGVIEPGAEGLAIMHGVSGIFGGSDVYEAYPPSDATMLVRGQVLKTMEPSAEPADYKKKRATDKVEQGVNDPMMPVAWTRLNKNEGGKDNRIFCTTMGAASDLPNEGLRRLVVNAVFWGVGLDVPEKIDVAPAGEFNPTFYGFNGFKKGVKPADLK